MPGAELPSATELAARNGQTGDDAIVAEEPAPRPRKSRVARYDNFGFPSYRERHNYRRSHGFFPFGW